ncbi:hypothetical protein [Capnocytophaga leadbetteri]|uniref:hypothetical protein n=1 Tax=Capnocytophaga leadbetteri TaxID=327575 RepID=UPI0028ED5A43|nr:hypothetical protein [Capnocytophaga leadbetteri]
MKIALTLTRAQAEILARVTFIEQPIFYTREQRVRYSLMCEVSIKITRFCISFIKQKKRKLSLKLYEADMLENYLIYILNIKSHPPYEKNTLQTIINDINKQLA